MNSKNCPYCDCSTEIVKIGLTSAKRQRYLCKACHKSWTNKSRNNRLSDKIWYDFVWNNMPVRTLAKIYQKHPNTIRTILHAYKPEPLDLNSLSKEKKQAITTIVMDTTYFGRAGGVVVIIDAHNGDLLYFHEIKGSESNTEYYRAIHTLLNAGIYPKACVIDGRKGVAEDLEDAGILVQMCHFHTWQIVKRYIAGEPLLTPNIELKSIMNWFISKHTTITKHSFAAQILGWKERHWLWLKEKHRNENGRLEWSHAETRRAYNSIISHAKWLFTYEKYPELNIPKTSNILEGKFGNAKDKLKLHHGYSHKLKIKIFFSLLSGG